jgi:molybdate transport system regulatory protein
MRIGALKVKLQFLCGDTLAFGPGKADLLDAIAAQGSISAAGRTLGISYRRCWLLVDEMNRCFADPLVETAPGGGNPRGAWLTDTGKRVLAAYRALEAVSAGLGSHEAYGAIAEAMLTAPRPAKEG